MNPSNYNNAASCQRRIRVRGIVQGVGFRPTVWHYAKALGLQGFVMNDGQGVVIECRGEKANIDLLIEQLQQAPPAQATIGSIEQTSSTTKLTQAEFFIAKSPAASAIGTDISADLATCADCLADIKDPSNRRYGYAFANCTHCGPRLSILQKLPYDRANTSMGEFDQCSHCLEEYHNPADRRFHAQPNACSHCGPSLWLTDANGQTLATEHSIKAAIEHLRAGKVLALKGIGGFQLVVDATNAQAVARLRQRKRRPEKPFALMARDLKAIEHYCAVDALEADLLASAAAPIVVLARRAPDALSGVAPGQTTLGFMLPTSPLHHLLLEGFSTPLVMTSGNPSGEPQCIDNTKALAGLAGIADSFLLHDRDILHRVDDSVVRVIDDQPRVLRRGRGYAPAPLTLPPGFEHCPPVLAMGAELKNTFCLLRQYSAVMSQHIGDLQDAVTLGDYEKALGLFSEVYQHRPHVIAIDQHPQYLSSQLGKQQAEREQLTLIDVQHHHAHIASCLGENQWPLAAGQVLGVALDGLGYARTTDSHSLWGGEIFLADYRRAQPLAYLKPVALLGGELAMHQPWRNCFAQLHAALGWENVAASYHNLSLVKSLAKQPTKTLLAMLEQKVNAPLSSSCGRLFDAVAAAIGFNQEGSTSFEGQAPMAMEAAINPSDWSSSKHYPFLLVQANDKVVIDPAPMWQALLDDLTNGVSQSTMAARFHQGFIQILTEVIVQLAAKFSIKTVALSGGCLQNARLLQGLSQQLQQQGLVVLSHRQLPANDGGIAFGQALIAAARVLPEDLGVSDLCV